MTNERCRPHGLYMCTQCAPMTTTAPGVDEAIRTLRLKLDVRKARHWTPEMAFSAEIQEVETLIAEVERLRLAATAAESRIKELEAEQVTDNEKVNMALDRECTKAFDRGYRQGYEEGYQEGNEAAHS